MARIMRGGSHGCGFAHAIESEADSAWGRQGLVQPFQAILCDPT